MQDLIAQPMCDRRRHACSHLRFRTGLLAHTLITPPGNRGLDRSLPHSMVPRHVWLLQTLVLRMERGADSPPISPETCLRSPTPRFAISWHSPRSSNPSTRAHCPM